MDAVTVLQQMQKEKVIGELKALKVSYYDPMGSGREHYRNVSDLIDGIIANLRNNI